MDATSAGSASVFEIGIGFRYFFKFKSVLLFGVKNTLQYTINYMYIIIFLFQVIHQKIEKNTHKTKTTFDFEKTWVLHPCDEL